MVRESIATGPELVDASNSRLCRENGPEPDLGKLTLELLNERARADEACAHIVKLESQINIILQSRLWRAAQLLRRLLGRPVWVSELARPASIAPYSESVDQAQPISKVFREIYLTNGWGGSDSRSGTGSTLEQTAEIRKLLPKLLSELDIHSMLDAPCGDFHWMRSLELNIDYIGADIVAELIAANNGHYGSERCRFLVLDISNDSLPQVDLVFCRDLLVHFSFIDAQKAIDNLKRSGSTYLLTTTFSARNKNMDINTGEWRPLNLEISPFNFPPPIRLFNEKCSEGHRAWSDKSLGLWKLSDL